MKYNCIFNLDTHLKAQNPTSLCYWGRCLETDGRSQRRRGRGRVLVPWGNWPAKLPSDKDASSRGANWLAEGYCKRPDQDSVVYAVVLPIAINFHQLLSFVQMPYGQQI